MRREPRPEPRTTTPRASSAAAPGPYIPDLWFQFLYKKFRFEAEGAMIYGSLENISNTAGGGRHRTTSTRTTPTDPG